jgi:hypothetical protein
MTRGQGGHARRYDTVGEARTGRLGAEKRQRVRGSSTGWCVSTQNSEQRWQRRGLDDDPARCDKDDSARDDSATVALRLHGLTRRGCGQPSARVTASRLALARQRIRNGDRGHRLNPSKS